MINSRYNIQEFADELELEMLDVGNLYNEFLLELQQAVEKMKDYEKAQNYVMLKEIVHGIKGLAANCRIEDVFYEAETFDKLLKENETHNCKHYVQIISEKFASAEDEIRRAFKEIGIEI